MTDNEARIGKVVIAGGGRNAGRIFKAQLDLLEELESYKAIGTVEEFKSLKEKNEPKKPIVDKSEHEEWTRCPSCKAHTIGRTICCARCGQKLDWK